MPLMEFYEGSMEKGKRGFREFKRKRRVEKNGLGIISKAVKRTDPITQ